MHGTIGSALKWQRIHCLTLALSYAYACLCMELHYVSVLISLISIPACLRPQRLCVSLPLRTICKCSLNLCGIIIPLIYSLSLALSRPESFRLAVHLVPLAIVLALIHTFTWKRGTLVNVLRYTLTLSFLTIPMIMRVDYGSLTILPLIALIGIVVGADFIPYALTTLRRSTCSDSESVFIIGGAMFSDAISLSTIIMNSVSALAYALARYINQL